MTRTTITGVRGTPLPNLEAAGLKRQMRAAHALIAEQDRLVRRAAELGHEQQRLQAEIKQLEHERTAEWGRAIRTGEEPPTDEAVQAASRRLEEVGREIAAVRHAGDLADAELKQTVAENAAEWDAEVQTKAERILAEAQQMADALSAKLAETEGLAALHGWLISGGQFYTPPMAAAVSIDNLIHERRRDLGLLDVEVVR
ncbi:MAG: hypothetical protein M3N18_07885 [Actinomycetota bacterium]|nr:hypothetical protein [Actinomycetota bacterium]